MPNVWEAMKKHEAEEAQKAEQAVREGPEPSVKRPGPDREPASGRIHEPVAAVLSADGQYSELLIVHHDRGGAITEEYRRLRTSLLAQCKDERFCYLVTSANAGEGKTVTCLNLGLVMAERVDCRAIVADCDLRKGKMADLLGARGSPGMADLLRGSATLEESIQPTCCPNLFFLPAGKAAQSETGELIGRPELDDIVGELRRQYDYVILDTPPIKVASDAGILGRAAGEALLVIRMNKTSRESVDEAIRLLHAGNVKISGIILTHQKYYIPNYLYRYS